LGNSSSIKKAIEKTIKQGKATPQKLGRTKYELDFGRTVGTKTDPATGVVTNQTKITVVVDKWRNVVTSFPSS
jgi:hypothetical protein